LIELKDYEQADELLQEALTVRQEIGYQAKVMEAKAWLARLHLERGDTAQALTLIEDVVAYLEGGGTLDSVSWPRWVYLNCFQVLRANVDPRANSILRAGYDSIQRIAAGVTDEAVRSTFLENVPWNSEIIALWETEQS
jgi:tetratricopeptide (TPR) repeat protein